MPDLNTHIASVHKEKSQFKRHTCSASFDLKLNCDKHIESVHEGKDQLRFNICHVSFAQNMT